MPDIEKETRNNSAGESANRLLIDAYALSSRTTACVEARSRQALVLAGGAIVGGVKDIPVELANHPWEVAGKLAAASATGVVLGAAAAVESPIIAGAAVVAGTVTTGFALWNSYARLSKNEKLEHALNS